MVKKLFYSMNGKKELRNHNLHYPSADNHQQQHIGDTLTAEPRIEQVRAED